MRGRQPGHRDTAGAQGHGPGSPARRPRSQHPGWSRRRKGRRGSHAPPKASLFRLLGGREQELQAQNLPREARQGAARLQRRRRCSVFSDGQSSPAVVCASSIPVLIQKRGYVVQLRIWARVLVWHELQLWAACRLLLALIGNFGTALVWNAERISRTSKLQTSTPEKSSLPL